MNKRNLFLITIFAVTAIAFAACGDAATLGDETKKIADKKINGNLTVTISNAKGKLTNGEQELVLQFTDGNGKPVEIKAASLNFNMPAMGSMSEMNDAATLKTTETPGKFTGSVKLAMAGEWIAQIGYEGKETGKTTITTTAY